MNYVLLDADNVVVARSKVASAFGEPEDFGENLTVVETEEWPEPGMVQSGSGFAEPAVPLDQLKDRARTAITVERDRRIAAGFEFDGVRYQSRPDDRENIAGAAQLAMQAVLLSDAEPGDLRWHGGDSDFVWIAEDNGEKPMDAQTLLGFARAAAAMKSACIFRAKALKDEVDAAADGEALDAIDITAGWPA